MKTHQDVDRRSLSLATAIVAKIDADLDRTGLRRARETCARWMRTNPGPAVVEWQRILTMRWEDIRAVLLREDQEGQRLRQNSPFCGVLTPRERWELYRRFDRESKAA